MTNCAAKTTNGKPCRGQAISGSAFCFAHDPASSSARTSARKRGGERRRVGHAADVSSLPKQVRSAADVQEIFNYTLAEALALENSVERCRLLIALGDTWLKAIGLREVEARITAVEKARAEEAAKQGVTRAFP